LPPSASLRCGPNGGVPRARGAAGRLHFSPKGSCCRVCPAMVLYATVLRELPPDQGLANKPGAILTARRAMKKHAERQAKFVNSSGIEIRPTYMAEHTRGIDPDTDIGLPGEFPFTRGIQPSMYRSRLWTMRQYAGFGSARETN